MKVEEEQSPPQSLFDSNGNKRSNKTQQAAEGGEERVKEDSGRPWRRPATVDWGGDES